jgi:hypothetical protein
LGQTWEKWDWVKWEKLEKIGKDLKNGFRKVKILK